MNTPLRVLVVDDERLFAELMRVALGSARYTRFGRSNEPTSSIESFSPSCAPISRLTRAVAVAVYA